MKQLVPLIALTLLFIVSAMFPLAYSIPLYMQELPQAFKDECTTCHVSPSGMGGVNRFGAAFANAGHSLASISTADSDGDGYTNREELAAGTFPGNPDSHPGSGSFEVGLDVLVFAATAVVAAVVVARFVVFRP